MKTQNFQDFLKSWGKVAKNTPHFSEKIILVKKITFLYRKDIELSFDTIHYPFGFKLNGCRGC